MKSISQCWTLCVNAFLFLISSFAEGDEIVAILDLQFIEDTGDTAVVICFGENDEDCGEYATYYLFEAKVDKVISGELPDDRFLVLFGKHALRKKNFRNVIALLEKRDTDDPDEPQYRISRWGEKRTMYCFDHWHDDDTEIGVLRNDEFELNCYEQKFYR